MAARKFYFRCVSNPTAPYLVLETAWEAAEMKNHPDYERVDECGEVIYDDLDDGAKEAIHVAPSAPAT